MELRNELFCPDDRASHQLREETQVEAEVQEVPHRLYAAFVFIRPFDSVGERSRTTARPFGSAQGPGCDSSGDIYDIADGLEDEERDADRKEDGVYAEIGVLVVAKEREVHHDTRHHDKRPPEFLAAMRQQQSSQIVIDYHKDQEHKEQATGLVIEKQTHEEQESVPQQHFILEETQESQHDGEKRPEIELGEQKRMGLIKREQVLQELRQNLYQAIHGFLLKCSIYLAINALYSKSPRMT